MKQCTNRVSIRHTSSAKERLEQAHKLMGITARASEQLGEVFKAMAAKPFTDAQTLNLIRESLAPSAEFLKKDEQSTRFTNMVNAAYEYGMSSPTQQLSTTRGTVFGAYNAITGYFQNVREFAEIGDKLSSILDGNAARISQKAFDLCLSAL
jgi:hypothetical protein